MGSLACVSKDVKNSLCSLGGLRATSYGLTASAAGSQRRTPSCPPRPSRKHFSHLAAARGPSARDPRAGDRIQRSTPVAKLQINAEN